MAQATAIGAAGIGIVRFSGPSALEITNKMLKLQGDIKTFSPRKTYTAHFIDNNNQIIDQGIVIYFKAPHSFTGEDTVEFQSHGAQVVIQQIIDTAIYHGARMARPGEFSEQAFLNGKIDLLQAEAIADLINASSARAARAALQSLTGYFSQQVNRIAQTIKSIRVQVEAAIDFSDEAIEPLSLQNLESEQKNVLKEIQQLLTDARKGLTLNSGIRVGLVGQPNVGKSRLLNRLLGYDRAMVTDIAGTTRDVLQESFHFQGIRFEIIDTAGLHQSDDALEQEGMRRTRKALSTCDLILVLQDIRFPEKLANYLQRMRPTDGVETESLESILPRCIGVRNKLDLVTEFERDDQWIFISAEYGDGLDDLCLELVNRAQFQQVEETQFVARRRHVSALENAATSIMSAQNFLKEQAYELLAEEMRLAHRYLGEMVGVVTSDELLGEIFSTFCIGK